MTSDYEREVREFLGSRGPLARLLPRYEQRPEQSHMAAAVLRALAERSILVVEAGTGTGKTLGYLVPCIYSGERVVISTGTKALQEQLMYKDLPVLEREFKIRAAIMKGRTNYLCWKRFREFNQAPSFKFHEETGFYEDIMNWAEKTKTGDRAEIKGLPDQYSAWREISASGEQCVFQKCEYWDQCFVTKMRARAQASDIVVVNHHLFFADLSIRGDAPSSVLPEYHTVVFDEAHSLPEIATEYFGVQVSNWRMADLGQDVRRLNKIGKVSTEDLRALLKSLESAELACEGLFKAVSEASMLGSGGWAEGSRFSLDVVREKAEVIEQGERAGSSLMDLSVSLSALSCKDEAVPLAERSKLLAGDLGFILSQDDPGHVYWAETRGRGVIMRASPAELGPILEELLFVPEMPVVFTSATLAVKRGNGWSFEHFNSELGLTEGDGRLFEKWLPSSYNFEEQAMLYVPNHLPEPTRPEFMKEAAREMLKIVRISKGRAFLLFTSYRNMDACYELLEPHLDYRLLKQGDAPRSELLAEFRDDEESVLFGTQSFWAGVDVSGPALSAVVVDKLPFASPSDPLVAARVSRIKRKGGNAFMSYQLPAAVILLKQGLGRLIRSRDDFGVLAVLDSRLHKKSYGRTFLDSLPPAPLTTRSSDLKGFFKRTEKS